MVLGLLVEIVMSLRVSIPPTDAVLRLIGFREDARIVLPPPPPPPGVLLLLTVITLVSVPLCVIVMVAPVHVGLQSLVFVTRRVAGVTPSVPDTCCTVN